MTITLTIDDRETTRDVVDIEARGESVLVHFVGGCVEISGRDDGLAFVDRLHEQTEP